MLPGVQHDFPSDKDRLVMPLPTSVPLAVIFFSLLTLLMGVSRGEPFFAGSVVGYLDCDGTHYYVHHFVITCTTSCRRRAGTGCYAAIT